MTGKRIRYHLDEHFPHAVAKALRQYGFDVTVPQEADLRQATDRAHLLYTSESSRVMVTYDEDFLRLHAEGIAHAGIAYVRPSSRNTRTLIEMLRLLFELVTADEMNNHVEFV